jgi:hypothetical protein
MEYTRTDVEELFSELRLAIPSAVTPEYLETIDDVRHVVLHYLIATTDKDRLAVSKEILRQVYETTMEKLVDKIKRKHNYHGDELPKILNKYHDKANPEAEELVLIEASHHLWW